MRVSGTVQGVGFRPFVHRVATELGLVGCVRNDPDGVVVEVQGDVGALATFAQRLVDDAPVLARIERVVVEDVALGGERTFAIEPSASGGAADTAISVDAGPCRACLREVDDPRDRRHRYPFANCTACGPRYTIVTGLPYDRPRTTMAAFALCDDCRREYEDPRDRRFHAQPVACPACGPRLAYEEPAGVHVDGAPFDLAVAALRDGRIVAVKGVGGYHLAVDGTREDAVGRLRQRKARDDKPFALLVGDVEAASALVELDEDAATLLASPARPIVVAPRRPGTGVAEAVAPGLPELGVLLPPSPLHHLLAAALGRPLVLTSGNRTDEPIAAEDDDARVRLGDVADGILLHDRAIAVRCDDSVVRSAPGTGLQVVRRSRGFAPEPLRLPVRAAAPVLAVGAELKSTIALARGTGVVASHHLGDLEHPLAYRGFLEAIDHLTAITRVVPQVVAHDLHPEYLSTKLAADLDLPSVGVQHHHAHVASCLVEHGEVGPVVGVAFDGTGYGTDGGLWGGEVLVADLHGFERVGHVRPVALPGGAAAIREPWRMAVAWADAAGADVERLGPELDPRWRAVRSLLARAATTTSAGRLFDAVAALLGIRRVVTYEGQAAVLLEAMARSATAPRRYDVRVEDATIDPAPLVAAVADDVLEGVDRPAIAAGFHAALADATARLAARVAARRGIDSVVLTGGVFQNALLSGLVADALVGAGLRVLRHHRVPANDGGISVGQAAVAAARLAP